MKTRPLPKGRKPHSAAAQPITPQQSAVEDFDSWDDERCVACAD